MRLTAWLLVVAATTIALLWLWTEAKRSTARVAVQSSQALRDSQIAGCERTLADRMDAIRGWTAARQARIETARNPQVPIRERLQAAAAAAVYREVIDGYRSRIVNCNRAFPAPRLP